jgi:hypothetical protein
MQQNLLCLLQQLSAMARVCFRHDCRSLTPKIAVEDASLCV